MLDAGYIRELDSPYRLLQNPSSYLSHVVHDAGLFEENKLRELAKLSHDKKTKPESVNSTAVAPVAQETENTQEKQEKQEDGVEEAKPLTDIPEIRIDTGSSYVTSL